MGTDKLLFILQQKERREHTTPTRYHNTSITYTILEQREARLTTVYTHSKTPPSEHCPFTVKLLRISESIMYRMMINLSTAAGN